MSAIYFSMRLKKRRVYAPTTRIDSEQTLTLTRPGSTDL